MYYIITTLAYVVMLGSRTCSFEAEYKNGKKVKFSLKGWYK